MTYRSRKLVFLGMWNVLVCLLPVTSGYQSNEEIRTSSPKTSSGYWLPKNGQTNNISFQWVSERTAHQRSEPLQTSAGPVFEEIEEKEGTSKGKVICIDQTAISMWAKGLNSLKIIGPIEQKNLHLSVPFRKHTKCLIVALRASLSLRSRYRAVPGCLLFFFSSHHRYFSF